MCRREGGSAPWAFGAILAPQLLGVYGAVSRLSATWRRTPEPLRRVVRTVTPASVKDILNRRLEAARLRVVASCECNTTRLRPVSTLNLADVFVDREIRSRWLRESAKLRAFRIPGGIGEVSPGERRALFYIVRALMPSTVLEIGTHVGASTVHIALAMELYSRTTSVQLISVDCADVNDRIVQPWRQHGCRYSPAEMIERMGCGYATEFVVDSSLSYLQSCGLSFDLVFLDGDHRAETVYHEIPLALELLNRDGVILLRDYYSSNRRASPDVAAIGGPYLAVKRLSGEGAALTVRRVGSLPWQTMQQTNLSSLALLLGDRD